MLHAVVPGRRYVIGKDEGADLRVDGTYASRRHAEIWLEGGGWRVADAGSTNGIRIVDERTGRTTRSSTPSASPGDAPIRIGEGMRVVLSARAEGPASDYPWIALQAAAAAASPTSTTSALVTPIAAAATAAPKTPLTSVRAVRTPGPRFEVSVSDDGGERLLPIAAETLPFTIGRSRDQSLVVDRRHAGVSGRHVAIDAIDDDGVHGVVEGDNGVVVDGVGHDTGARFAWRSGQALLLGGALPGEPTCSLTLSRSAEH